MTEKIILKETVTTGRPGVEKKPKKRTYKPRKKKEITEENLDNHQIDNSEKPYLPKNEEYKIVKKVGKYCIGAGEGFCIHFEKKPNWLHRKCMKLFLGWKWNDYKTK